MTQSIDTFEDTYKVLSQWKNIPVAFVTPDVHYAMGFHDVLPNYSIFTLYSSPLCTYLRDMGVPVQVVQEIRGGDESVFLLPRTSEQILEEPAVTEALSGLHDPKILFFKTSAGLEALCQGQGWQVLASSSRLSRTFENKLRFQTMLREMGLPAAPGEQCVLGETSYETLRDTYGDTIVIQHAKGFGGNKTFLVRNTDDFKRIQDKYAGKTVKVTKYMDGVPVTINACVTRQGIAIPGPFFQITGIPELTPHILGACGNDWNIEQLPESVLTEIYHLTNTVGMRMKDAGYKGIFGLDFVVTDDGQVLLIEDNARMIASITLFTRLQKLANEVPLLALHLLEHLDIDYSFDVAEFNWVSQIPRKAAQFILHNLEGKTCRINGDVRPGIYKWSDGSFVFDRPGVSVDQCAGDEYFVIASAPGRLVNPGIECCRVQFRGKALSGTNMISENVKNIAQILYGALKLEVAKADEDEAESEDD